MYVLGKLLGWGKHNWANPKRSLIILTEAFPYLFAIVKSAKVMKIKLNNCYIIKS